MIPRLRAAFWGWVTRTPAPLDVDSVRAYRDATHLGMCDIGQGFGRSNLERVLDNERYLESFDSAPLVRRPVRN